MDDNNAIIDFINEVISASPEYALKEKIRQKLQDSIIKRIKTKNISSQQQLDEYLSKLASNPKNELAVTALKSVPFQVWQMLALKS